MTVPLQVAPDELLPVERLDEELVLEENDDVLAKEVLVGFEPELDELTAPAAIAERELEALPVAVVVCCETAGLRKHPLRTTTTTIGTERISIGGV